MNMLFITYLFVGFMVSQIPIVSIFGSCPYSVTFPYRLYTLYTLILDESRPDH